MKIRKMKNDLKSRWPQSYRLESQKASIKIKKILKNKVAIVKIDRKLRRYSLSHIIMNEVEYSCSHDYDCCGCWFTRVNNIKKIGKNKYEVSYYSAQNY